MLNIVNKIIASMSLGFFCMGLNFYIDMHLGFEFLSTVIALEVASVLIAVAAYKKIDNININIFVLVTLWFLIASCYLLYAIAYITVFSYFIALLCATIPVILIGILIVNNWDTISIKSMMLSVLAGILLAIVIAYMVMEREGIWAVFMLASATLTLSIVVQVYVSNLVKVSALCLLIGMLFINNESLSNQLANWSLSDKPVAKYSLNMLNDPDKRGWSDVETTWGKGGRVDVVSTSRSRNEGKFWAIHDANILVPFARKAKSSIPWWKEHYPLLILPFELKNPSRVLTIATARGADAEISQQLYDAETTSVYHDCVSSNDSASCNSLPLNIKLEKALNSGMHYDLVSFSIFNKVVTPYVGASASHEAIHTIEVFHKLYDSLNSGGLLAINSRDQVMLHKTLSYVWRVLSDDDEDKIVKFENNIRILMLNKYALNNDAYNYLVLVSKDGFTAEQLEKMSAFISSSPVEKAIYDSANNIPPYILFKQRNALTVSAAISHLTLASSWQFKKLLNLEPSSVLKPDFFHLSKELHPFVSALSAIFLLLAIYGFLFSHRNMRHLGAANIANAPVLSLLLLQPFLCAVAFVLLLYSIVDFASASLGYSALYVSLLMLLVLAAFAIPHVFIRTTTCLTKSIRGVWFYLVILLLCVSIIMSMSLGIDILPGSAAQAVVLVLAVLLAFCAGQIHHQSALFVAKIYSGVWFWFWCMTSVGTVLGLILSKYILIGNDLSVMVKTAMVMFVFMAGITWWCLIALQDKSATKTDSMQTSG